MKIVIVGVGKLGKNLTKYLTLENHDIVVIDNNEGLIEDIVNEYDVLGYSGNGASYDVLVEAGAENADLLIAVTSSDEVNILSCLVAKKLKIKQTIARVRNIEYAKQLSILNEELGISTVINPDLDAANEIVRLLQFPSATKVETFANKKVNLVELIIKEDSPLGGLSLTQMKDKYNFNVLVCAIKRKGEVIIPRGDFILNGGDDIFIAGSAREIVGLFKKLGIYKQKLKSTMIIGGSRIGYFVARELLKSNIQVKIIEENREKCDELSELLEGATIICGDGTNQELLLEEGIDKVDSMIALTGLDETNIILSLYCKNNNCPKTITKVNNENYLNILGDSVKLDSVVTPKSISSDIIVRYVRGIQSSEGNDCKTMYHIVDGSIEALEFSVPQNSKLINIPLKDLNIRKDILLACIIHEGKVITPTGKDIIEANDTLIIIAPNLSVRTLEDIIE